MKIQNLNQNVNMTRFSSTKKSTKNPLKTNETKTHSSNTLKSLAILGTAMLASLNISACTPTQKPSEAQNETTAKIESETNSNNSIEDILGDKYTIDETKPEKPAAAAPKQNSAGDDDSTGGNYPGPETDTQNFEPVEGNCADLIIDNRTDEEKFDLAKEYIQEALDTLEYVHNEVWNNFPKMYDKTKELDGITISPVQPGNGNTYTDYNEKGDFEKFYSEYRTIASIAAGESEPWKEVNTGKDAAKLILRLLQEATGGVDHMTYLDNHSEINAKDYINKGELDVIYLVLDKLGEINPDTGHVATIFRTELETEREKYAELKSQNTMESKLDGKKGEALRSSYIENIDIIEGRAAKIKEAKQAYEEAKLDFINGNYTPDNKDKKLYELQNNLNDLYTACNWQINSQESGSLNTWNVNTSIEISNTYARTAMENATKKASAFLEIPLSTGLPDTNKTANKISKQISPSPVDDSFPQNDE